MVQFFLVVSFPLSFFGFAFKFAFKFESKQNGRVHKSHWTAHPLLVRVGDSPPPALLAHTHAHWFILPHR
jgi:hypothetical protein